MNDKQKQEIAFKYLVNKMLKKHGVDIDYVMKNPKIEDEDWNTYYTWTSDERKDFFKEGVEYLKQVFRWNNKRCLWVMQGFILQHGLKIQDNATKPTD